MRRLIFTLAALLVITSASAQQVSHEVALSRALAFLHKTCNMKKGTNHEPKLSTAIERSELYVFNDEAGGYVVVSGEERTPSILGFSPDGKVDALNMPCNMRAWLQEYAAQIDYLRTHPNATVTPKGTPEEREIIPPLMDCLFSQGEPYNYQCPVNPQTGNLCVTGCVATAMAQIMYRHKWPLETADVIPDYSTPSLDIGLPEVPITTIDWENIINDYNYYANYTSEQADAIATLMHLCGCSVQMDYAESSGASSENAANAFYRFFDYDNYLEHRSRFSDEEWEELLYDELKESIPNLFPLDLQKLYYMLND